VHNLHFHFQLDQFSLFLGLFFQDVELGFHWKTSQKENKPNLLVLKHDLLLNYSQVRNLLQILAIHLFYGELEEYDSS